MCDMECTVNGALVWVLRISQMVGIAPVQLVSSSEGFTVRFSRVRYNTGRIINATYTIFVVVCLIWDLTSKFSLNVDYLLIDTVVSVSIIVNTLLFSAMTFKGLAYVKRLILFMNTIQKVDLAIIEDSEIRKTEKRRIYLLNFHLCFLLILNIWTIYSIDVSRNGGYLLTIKIISFCVGYLVIIIQIIRFAFNSLMLHLAFRTVNFGTRQLLTDVKCKNIDRAEPWAYKKVRNLANTYTYLCDALRTQNDEIQGELALITTLIWTYSVFPVYTLVMWIRKEKASFLGNINIFRQLTWCVVHFVNMLLLVEPCQRINEEMQLTQYYITQIMHFLPRSAIVDPLDNELEMFFRILITEKPSYEPFQLFTLNRQLIVKIITGGISYLVMALQFKYWD